MGKLIDYLRTLLSLSAICLLALFVPSANAGVRLSDLAGTWEGNGLASGPGDPWWCRSNVIADSEGRVSGSGVDSDDKDYSYNGVLTFAADGWLQQILDGEPGIILCSTESQTTFLACTTSWADYTANLVLSTKMATPYSYLPTDLEGTWEMNALASGPGAPWWLRATIKVESDGDFSGPKTESNGNKGLISGTFSMTSNGIITGGGDPNFRAVMDAGKTVIVGTETWSGNTAPGTTDIMVITKKADSYSMSDLAGKWHGHALASGPGAPWWSRYRISISPDGAYSGKEERSDGSVHDNKSGALTISTDGIITCSGTTCDGKREGDLQGVMDAGKTVMVFTSTWTDESSAPGTTQIWIFTKDSPNIDPGVMMLLLE